MSASRALNGPRPVRVRVGATGVPETVDGQRIEHLCESWLVEDRWWTAAPLRRRYWELVSARGRNLVVFHDLGGGGGWPGGAGGGSGGAGGGGWFAQRG
ncbi:MAG TPA: hypothetical protein VID29_03010 [Solirubrobacteraceae bacterium]|jgi:hypothetical protein